MALLDVARSRIRYQSPTSKRVGRAGNLQRTWRTATLEFFGTLFVLIGLAVGLLTLRLLLVLIHGALH
jgi:hypothetical protein